MYKYVSFVCLLYQFYTIFEIKSTQDITFVLHLPESALKTAIKQDIKLI